MSLSRVLGLALPMAVLGLAPGCGMLGIQSGSSGPGSHTAGIAVTDGSYSPAVRGPGLLSPEAIKELSASGWQPAGHAAASAVPAGDAHSAKPDQHAEIRSAPSHAPEEHREARNPVPSAPPLKEPEKPVAAAAPRTKVERAPLADATPATKAEKTAAASPPAAKPSASDAISQMFSSPMANPAPSLK